MDARAAISLYGADRYVSSLTTICSPHKGLSLIDAYNKKREQFNFGDLDRPLEMLGVSVKNAEEYCEANMNGFNKFVQDSEKVHYFSVGAQKDYDQMPFLLS